MSLVDQVILAATPPGDSQEEEEEGEAPPTSPRLIRKPDRPTFGEAWL